MRDENKTKKQLLAELAEARRQVAELTESISDLDPMRKELQNIRKRYLNITESFDIAVCRWLPDTTLTYTNDSYCRIFGTTKDKALNARWLDFIPEAERESVSRVYRDLADHPRRLTYEHKIITKEGADRWFFWIDVPIFDDCGKLLEFQSVGHDITEKKLAEEALKESETKFRLLMEATAAAIYLIQDNNFVYINPAMEKLTGYTIDELAGIPFWNFIHPEFREMVKEKGIKRQIGEEPAERYELKIVTKNGREKWVDLSATLFITLDNKPTIMGSLFDITERRKTEDTLKESEEKYRGILSNITDGYFETDLQGNFTFFNNILPQVMGYTASEMQGMSNRVYIDKENRQIISCALRDLYSNAVPSKAVSYEFSKKDGKKVYVETVFSLIRNDTGKATGLRGIARDITERKNTEEALRRTEEILLSMFDAVPVGLCIMNDRIYQKANKFWYDSFGYSEDEIIGQSTRMLYDSEEEYIRVGRELYENMQIHGQASVQTKIRSKDGIFRDVILTAVPLHLKNDSLDWVVVIEDITERKQIEDDLKRSEYLYRSIFKNTGNANLLLRTDTTIILVNSEFEKLSGYSKEELEGKKSWTEFIAPHDLPRMMQYSRRRRTDAGSAPRKYEFQFVDRCGQIRDMDISVDMIPDTGESIVSLHDVTEHKQAEKTLRDSQRRLADIIDFLPDATFVINKEDKVIAWNRAIENMTGIRKEDMLGKSDNKYSLPFYGDRRSMLIDLVLHPEREMPKHYTAIQKVGDVLFGEAFIPNLPHGAAHLSATTSVLRDEKGEAVAAIECLRDNTERKKLEERLSRAEKMEVLGRLAGGVAHDLNNILGVLVGYSELLAEGLPENSPLKKYTDSILKSSIKSSAIIQDLLTLARRGVAVAELVNLNKTLRDYLQTPEFEKLKSYHPHVDIQIELAPDLFNIKGSPVHLGKTIMNLISNAAEAIKDYGDIIIKTENRHLDRPIRDYEEMQEGDYVVLSVSDTGSGISACDRDKIFEPFYTKKAMGRSGTGLGLAVVWGTVKDHQGYIDVQSEEGKGSTFSLYFPATRETAVKIEKTVSPEAYKSKGESILIVDDIAEQRELATNMLTRLGYRVAAVSGGEKAVEYLKTAKADLVLLDMIMDPGIDGMETYRRILEVSPGQKAVIVSGFSETDRVRKTQEMGAGEFVRKPYIMEKIGLAIRNELDRKTD